MNMFTKNRMPNVPLNKFDRSHEVKMSLNMGYLYPFYWDIVYPKDRFRMRSEIFGRVAPMLAPILHRVNVFTHYWEVPIRLIFEEFHDFITGGEDGLDATVWPHVDIKEANKAYFYKGRLPDFMGIPPTDSGMTITDSIKISALPFRAYQKIYNIWYRDQDLQSEADYGGDGEGEVTSTADIGVLTGLRQRCWEKDYFTSARPDTQKGAEIELDIDLELKAIAQFLDNTGADYSGGNVRTFEHSTTGQLRDTTDLVTGNLETIDSATLAINNLRYAARLQEWLEINMRSGSRYRESVLGHFGVKTDDNQIEIPRYLGGSVSPLQVSEVLNTTGDQDSGWDQAEPAGSMAGHGIIVDNVNGFQKFFNEHSIVMGIISVLPKTSYQQGIDKVWTDDDKLEWYWPKFAHLGEQEVKQFEVYMDYEAVSGTDIGTFGYQSRYAHLKYKPSYVVGDMRDTLDFWHMGRQFSSAPSLNATFVKSDPTHRIFANTDEDDHKLYFQIYNRLDCLRPMPYFGTPKL